MIIDTRFPGDLVEHARAFAVLAAEIDVPDPSAFERAARKLHVDPSVLRRRLGTLTDFAGGPLVAGRGLRMRLTPLGARMRGGATRVLEAVAAIRTGSDPIPRIVVASTEAVSTELLPDALAHLRRTSPARVALRRLGTDACVGRLLSGDVHVGIVRGASDMVDRWPSPLQGTYLGADRLWIAAPRSLVPRSIRARELARAPLVLYGPASATTRRVLSGLGAFGATIALDVDGRATALAYAKRGFGIAFLSLLAGHVPRAPGLAFRDVTRLFPRSGFWLLLRDDAPPIARTLAASIARLARQGVKDR